MRNFAAFLFVLCLSLTACNSTESSTVSNAATVSALASTLGKNGMPPRQMVATPKASGTQDINTLLYGRPGNPPAGTFNVAFGINSFLLDAVATGYQNTAFGGWTLSNDRYGKYNSAFGFAVLQNTVGDPSDSQLGSENSAFGAVSLNNNTIGYQNTALGGEALQFNTTGYFNTAAGVEALWQNTTGVMNTSMGVSSLTLNTVGNNNSAFGENALDFNVNGSFNVAMGSNALYANCPSTDPDNQIAYPGNSSYQNPTCTGVQGTWNTAIGSSSLQNNSTGYNNWAGGGVALTSNTSGSFNSATGYWSLYANTTGSFNTVDGSYALNWNTTGSYNTAIGWNAGVSTDSTYANKTGNNNTWIGSYSGAYQQVTGASLNNATAIGFEATNNNNNQVVLGNAAVTDVFLGSTLATANLHAASMDISKTVSGMLGPELRLENNAANASDQAQISFSDSGTLRAMLLWNIAPGGDASWDFHDPMKNASRMFIAANTGHVGIGTSAPQYSLDVNGDIRTNSCLHYSSSTLGNCSSDERLKKDIQPFELGLKEILGINPVTFKYNGLGGNPEDGKLQFGVIAQQVEKVAPELVGNKELKLYADDPKTTSTKTVDYGAFTYMIINSVKEFYHQWFDDSQAMHRELASLRQENAELKARLDKIESALK